MDLQPSRILTYLNKQPQPNPIKGQTMGTPLGTDRQTAFIPALKLVTIGDKVDFAVIDEEVVPAYVFGSNPRVQATTQAGKPKTQDKVTVLVIKGTALIADMDEDGKVVEDANGKAVLRECREGDVATIWFEGQNRWDKDLDAGRAKGAPKSWSGAKEDVGGLQCGDVGRWVYERDLQGQGASPRKVRIVQLRRPKPEEAARSELCEELHAAGRGGATKLGDNGDYPDADTPF